MLENRNALGEAIPGVGGGETIFFNHCPVAQINVVCRSCFHIQQSWALPVFF